MRELQLKQFVYFLLLATVIWFFNHLSKPVTVSTVVKARFSQTPDSLTLLTNAPFDIPVRVTATGFRLLFTFTSNKPYDIPLHQIAVENDVYFLAPEYIESALQSAFSESLTLVRASISPKQVDVALLSSKRVPIVPQVIASFRPNHIAIDSAFIDPSTVEVRGVKSAIEQLDKVYTEIVRLEDIHESVAIDLPLEQDANSLYTLSSNSVHYSLNVTRFSENTFELPITVRADDRSMRLLLFPDKVTLVCKASTERLKTLKADDFEVSVDFDDSVIRHPSDQLKLRLTRIPEGIFQVSLLTDSVNYIIEPL